jgi:pimeloyl-ACP methyl ester carboxylesterase
MNIMDSQIIQTASGPIEYTLQGSGPLLLVSHGVSSSCYSNELARPLAEAGFQVLTPSRPGYGHTPLSVGMSAAQAAQAFMALMDSLSFQKCSVVAVSGGGPTGIALAANYPERVERLVLVEAISWSENRTNELSYQSQVTFYGPMHNVMWTMLGMMGRLSPRSMARQTLAIFSTHDPDDGLSKLSRADIDTICRFYRGKSSRQGALSDFKHTVGVEELQKVSEPTLVIHSREDNSVPFGHAEWSLQHIAKAELCESGITGHFFWVGPDFPRISQRMIEFLKS